MDLRQTPKKLEYGGDPLKRLEGRYHADLELISKQGLIWE